MATKNLATVPSTELSDSVNFITESEGELVRLPYALIKEKIDTINTEITNLNNLIGGNTAGIEKIQSQFIYANSKAEIISAMEKLDLERTYTCFLSAACVTELTTNYSVAAKGYVSKPAATMIDLCIQVGSDDVLFGRLNTSTGLFTFNETCTISELNALATTVSNIQSTVSGHTTNIQTNATNIANNASAITQLNSDSSNTKSRLGEIRWIPGANIGDPSSYFALDGWAIAIYFSLASISTNDGWNAILGMVNHNNGDPVGFQYGFGINAFVSRKYVSGSWTEWE